MAESLNERYSRLMRGPACAGKGSRHSFNTRLRRMGYSDAEIATGAVLREQGDVNVIDQRLLCQPLVDWVRRFWDYDNADIIEGRDRDTAPRPTKAWAVEDAPSIDAVEDARAGPSVPVNAGKGSKQSGGYLSYLNQRAALAGTPPGGLELAEDRKVELGDGLSHIHIQGDDIVVRVPDVGRPQFRSQLKEIGKLGLRVAERYPGYRPGLSYGDAGTYKRNGPNASDIAEEEEGDEPRPSAKGLPGRCTASEFVQSRGGTVSPQDGPKDKGSLFDYLVALKENGFTGIPECGVTHPQAGQLGQLLINWLDNGFTGFEGELLLALARADVLASTS